MAYPSLPVGDFAYRSPIIFRREGQRHFPVCSQKNGTLTLPLMKYFEILTHHYASSNKEFEEFPTSFASSNTSYFIRLFDILTSFVRKYYVAYLKYHALFKPNSSPCFGVRSNKGSSSVKEPVKLTDDVKQRKQ